MIAGRSSFIGLALIAGMLFSAAFSEAQNGADPIPESDISDLEQLLREGASGDGRSGAASRRAFKNVARKGLALAASYPDAPNRFRVLGLVVECQKRMLAMGSSEKNREALFETCEKLMEAPDKYALERLEADLLLSDRDLSARDATLKERAEALAELLSRYEGTSAEARSLLMAALIVQKLDSRELEGRILYALDEKFSDDHEVIEFRRKYLKISRLDLVFTGRHQRIDGTEVVFPSDTMGHMSMMVFWSKNKPGVDQYLDSMKAAVTNSPGRIDVFSFNLDELPDGGASVLKSHDLDWIPIKLPGGRNSQAYRTYAQGDPVAVLVNEYGMTVTRPEIVHGRAAAVDGSRISDDRYMAQLQSLFIGDWLVESMKKQGAGSGTRNMPSALAEVMDCFVQAPFRYRLSREQALASYSKAAGLAAEVSSRAPRHVSAEATQGEPAWEFILARNCRIIALLGMWNLACEPGYLEDAVKEAKLVMEAKLPFEAQVASRFCLATKALRAEPEKLEPIVSAFLADCGGEDAPAAALAAASVLAIEARSRELYDAYRARFLATHADDPGLYEFTAFLRDRHCQHRVLKANHTLRERRARSYIVGHGYPWPTNYLPEIVLKNLDGSKLVMPKETNGQLTYLLFIEPPAGGGTNNWQVVRDSRGQIREQSGVQQVMGYANDLTKDYLNGDINFVAAFLTDDAAHVKYLVETNGWNCTPAIVPGGLANPMARQLGVVSADRFPNVFVLRRDGSIAWHGSGLRYKNTFGFPFAYLLAMKVHVEVCEVELGYKLLEKGDYKEAAMIFSGPFAAAEPDRFAWRSPRYHGLTQAYIGLEEWDAALDSIDKAIDAHKLRHFHGYGRRQSIPHWREDAAKVTIKEPCDIICMLWRRKAGILEKLGRKDEAGELRKRGEKPVQEHYAYVYEMFHEKLNDLDLLHK